VSLLYTTRNPTSPPTSPPKLVTFLEPTKRHLEPLLKRGPFHRAQGVIVQLQKERGGVLVVCWWCVEGVLVVWWWCVGGVLRVVGGGEVERGWCRGGCG
jgi:hypothetical protein